MNVEHHSDPVEGIGHERRDVSVAGAAIFIIVIEVSMLGCCVLGYVFHKGYLHWMKVSAAKVSPMADYVVEAPEPRLQSDPSGDIQRYREVQTSLASTYGWVDTQKAIVRLPLDRAKEIIAERGLPSRPESNAQ